MCSRYAVLLSRRSLTASWESTSGRSVGCMAEEETAAAPKGRQYHLEQRRRLTSSRVSRESLCW